MTQYAFVFYVMICTAVIFDSLVKHLSDAKELCNKSFSDCTKLRILTLSKRQCLCVWAWF